MLRKIGRAVKILVVVSLLFVVLGAGLAFYCWRADWFPGWALGQVLGRYYPDYQVVAFSCPDRELAIPYRLDLGPGELVLLKGKERVAMRWRKWTLVSEEAWWAGSSVWKLLITGARFELKPMVISNLQIKGDARLMAGKLQQFQGTLKVEDAAYDLYGFKDIEAILVADPRQLRLNDLKAQAYGGAVTGEILLDYVPRIAYSIALDLERIDLLKLQTVNPEVFSQVEGLVSGNVQVGGNEKSVTRLQSSLQMPQGGKIQAKWLGPVATYIPLGPQKSQLEGLIKVDGQVPVEKASVTLQNLTAEKATALMVINSRQLNLNINLTLDVNVEGGLQELLAQTKLFSFID